MEVHITELDIKCPYDWNTKQCTEPMDEKNLEAQAKVYEKYL